MRSSVVALSFVSILAAGVVPAGAVAVSPVLLRSFEGAAAGQKLGSVLEAADVNADGIVDYIVGEPDFGAAAGRVVVYDGATDFIIWIVNGATAGARFGAAVAGAGDTNGDGGDDVIVGEPVGWPSHAYLLSGADGSLLFTFTGEKNCNNPFDPTCMTGGTPIPDGFGSAVAGVGDVDGDARGDFLIGAPTGDYTPPDIHGFGSHADGRVYAISGATGTTIRLHNGGVNCQQLGGTICVGEELGAVLGAAGDLDGDSVGDYLAVARRYKPVLGIFTTEPAVHAYSGATGAQLHILESDPGDPFAGITAGAFSDLAPGGDLDGDAVADYLAVQANGTAYDGRVYARAGAAGTALYTAAAADLSQVEAVGNVDLEVGSDYVVGLPGFDGVAGADSGEIEIRTGPTGAAVGTLEGANAGDNLGARVAMLGDVNSDGFVEIAVSSPGFDGTAGADTGLIEIYGLQPVCTDADGDGYGAFGAPTCPNPGVDCDDADPAVNPGATEIPGNGVDDDCDPGTPGGCIPAETVAVGSTSAFGYIAVAGLLAGLGWRRRVRFPLPLAGRDRPVDGPTG